MDIAEGQPPLKLPFNNSQDPWAVAQKLIHDHQLSQQYLDTVANFIIKNSKPGELRPPFHFFPKILIQCNESHLNLLSYLNVSLSCHVVLLLATLVWVMESHYLFKLLINTALITN